MQFPFRKCIKPFPVLFCPSLTLRHAFKGSRAIEVRLIRLKTDCNRFLIQIPSFVRLVAIVYHIHLLGLIRRHVYVAPPILICCVHPLLYDQNQFRSEDSLTPEHSATLTPMHLRKAKLMFFWVRYPSSAVLKMYFPDIRFNKNNTAQLVKWFSNFR